MNRSKNIGFGLIEVIIAMSIMMLGMFALAQMMESQQKDTRALAEKLAALDFQNLLISVYNSSVCKSDLTGASNGAAVAYIDTSVNTPIASIPLTKIHASVGATDSLAAAGMTANPLTPKMIISDVKLSNIKPISGTVHQYTAQVEVDFKGTLRGITPATVSAVLTTDGAKNPGKETVIDCALNGGNNNILVGTAYFQRYMINLPAGSYSIILTSAYFTCSDTAVTMLFDGNPVHTYLGAGGDTQGCDQNSIMAKVTANAGIHHVSFDTSLNPGASQWQHTWLAVKQ